MGSAKGGLPRRSAKGGLSRGSVSGESTSRGVCIQGVFIQGRSSSRGGGLHPGRIGQTILPPGYGQ